MPDHAATSSHTRTPSAQLTPPPAGRPGDDTTIHATDPATGEALGDVHVHTREEIEAMIAMGRKAQVAWGKTSFAERRAVLRTVLAMVVERQEELCRLAVRDSGKTMVDAAMGEVFPVCEKLRYTIAHGAAALAPQRRRAGFLMHKQARVEYRPLGVVAVICPWNFPLHNLFCPTIPALFAGNAVVAKVSEWTSWSAAPYLEIWQQALRKHGHDPKLVQVVTGYGDAGAALVRGGVDKVFFTGSPGNGVKVMAGAADTLTPVVLELGGKDPMIILDDADLDRAVDASLLGVFTACGQMCVGAERLYVHAGVYDRFVEKVRAKVAALRQGPPLGAEIVDCGAMTMPHQLNIVESLVQDAVDKGARALVGGQRNTTVGPQFFAPTLLVDVDHRMRITQEECFGPVMVVIKVRDDADAVRLANDCPFGLGSSIFSRDRKRAEAIAAQLRTGMTVVNDYGVAYMMQDLPFGGVGISGIGRINGPEGLRACCYEHAVVTDFLPVGKSVAVHPIQPGSYGMVEGAVKLIYGDSLKTRATGALQAARSLLSMRRSS